MPLWFDNEEPTVIRRNGPQQAILRQREQARNSSLLPTLGVDVRNKEDTQSIST